MPAATILPVVSGTDSQSSMASSTDAALTHCAKKIKGLKLAVFCQSAPHCLRAGLARPKEGPDSCAQRPCPFSIADLIEHHPRLAQQAESQSSTLLWGRASKLPRTFKSWREVTPSNQSKPISPTRVKVVSSRTMAASKKPPDGEML